MSRIGNRKLIIPEGVTVTCENNNVTVSGKLGTLKLNVNEKINIKTDNNTLSTIRKNDTKQAKQLQGTTNALIKDMIVGVTEGYKKELEINGVGYKTQVSGNTILINAGYSHQVKINIPEYIKVECPSINEIIIKGYDKQAVGEFASQVRKTRLPEPYKGKGIKYKEEIIKRKEGKKAA